MIVEHGATVIPFTQALLRAPKSRTSRMRAVGRQATDGPLPDNVVVLARFVRTAGSANGRFRPDTPPDDEAA